MEQSPDSAHSSTIPTKHISYLSCFSPTPDLLHQSVPQHILDAHYVNSTLLGRKYKCKSQSIIQIHSLGTITQTLIWKLQKIFYFFLNYFLSSTSINFPALLVLTLAVETKCHLFHALPLSSTEQ
jgi:hypothetical protein